MSFSNLIVSIEGAIARVTINRPEKLNALNQATIGELHQTFDQLSDDDTIRVVILTGAGDKAFVAGADISEINTQTPTDAQAFAMHGQQLMLKIENLGKPVIARVNGYALGGGCELALACTLRVAVDSARLGLPEITLGLLPGFGGTQRMTRLIGASKAMEFALTGQQVDAPTAAQLGLVNQLAAPKELDETVDKLAGRLARSAPIAMKHIMAAINRGTEATIERGIEYETQLFALCCATEDMQEGTRAFLGKRKPQFKGV